MKIDIDDDINAIDLAIQDKVALASMRHRPRIGNGALAKLLGLSDSGVRTMLRRFKTTGLIREFSIDGTREFKVLIGSQSGGSLGRQNLTKTGTPEIRQKMTGDPPPGSTPEQRSHWKSERFGRAILELDEASRSINHLRMAGYFTVEFSRLVHEIGSDPDLRESDRTSLLRTAETLRNFYTAASHVHHRIPNEKAPAAIEMLHGATEAQLATLYERIQGGQLGAGSDPLLIDIAADR